MDFGADGGEDSDIDIDRAVRKAAVIGGIMCMVLLLGAVGYYVTAFPAAPTVTALASAP
jgi:uncharacterized membrane protein